MKSDFKERFDRINTARDAILDHLKSRYDAKDPDVQPAQDTHRWHKPQKNYFFGVGSMPCPVCKTCTLRYCRASYNGHVHGRCTTETCVRWME